MLNHEHLVGLTVSSTLDIKLLITIYKLINSMTISKFIFTSKQYEYDLWDNQTLKLEYCKEHAQ